MRLVRILLALAVAHVGTWTGAQAQPLDEPRVEAGQINEIVQGRALSRIVSELRTGVSDCEVDTLAKLICILAEPNNAAAHRSFLTETLSVHFEQLQMQPASSDTPELHFVIGATAIALLHAEVPRAGAADALLLARTILDKLLLARSSLSTDPNLHNVSAMMYAEMYLVDRSAGFVPQRATIWLTNLGNSLARQARYIQNRETSAATLETAFTVRRYAIQLLEDFDDPLALGRAYLNLGNTYVQAGEWVDAASTDLFVDRSADSYERSISMLIDDAIATDPTANRLLTVAIAMRALSMPRGSGDNYLAHRRGIGMIKYLREELPHRVSAQREVDLIISELSLRTQLISRLATNEQRLAQTEEALRLLEAHAPTAAERRPEPDTPLSIGLLAVTLYAERGRLSGNASDCRRSKDQWRRVAVLVPRFPGTAGGGRAERSLLSLLDCEVATDPALAVGSEFDRIKAKRTLYDRYLSESPLLKGTPPLYAAEVEAELRYEAGEDNCAAARAMDAAFPLEVVLSRPELWDLHLAGLNCRKDIVGLAAFIAYTLENLETREMNEARSRSGVAFVSRALRQPLTDYVLELAAQGFFAEAYWALGFRDQSRLAPLVGAARTGLETLQDDDREFRQDAIAQWLRYDNPSDLETGYSAHGFEGGRIVLKSDAAAETLGLAETVEVTEAPENALQRVMRISRDRTVAYLLVGKHRAGWLVAAPDRSPFLVEIPMRRASLDALLERRFGESQSPVTEGMTFFESREALTQERISVERWHVALDGLSEAIAPTVVAPLLSEIVHAKARQTPVLTLVVRNELADLPIHGIDTSSAAPCGRALIDCFAVTYAADIKTLEGSLITEPLTQPDISAFWGFSDKSNAVGVSLALYQSLFDQMPGASVTTSPEQALDTLGGEDVGLWVVHGEFNATDPMRSVFELDAASALSPVEILSRAPPPKGRRLQILIGCDGALFDTIIQPTEQSGLAEPFLQLGIPAAILPNWESEQVASLVFTQRLVEELQQGISPVHAYREAMLFLRDADVAEVISAIDPGRIWLTPDTRAYRVIADLINQRMQYGSDDLGLFGHLSRFAAFKLVEGVH